MFVDDDADGGVDAGEELLYVHEVLDQGLTIRATSGAQDSVTYRANGMTSLSTAQVLVLCDERGYGADARDRKSVV